MARAGALAYFALSCLTGCDGTVVNLGNTERLMTGGDAGAAGSAVAGTGATSGSGGGPEWVPIAEPILIEPGHSLANPTFADDAEYVLFTRQAPGADNTRVWQAEREGDGYRLPSFKTDEPLPAGGDSIYGASTPALFSVSNELWFGSFVADAFTDVFVTSREGDGWSAAVPVAELSSPEDDAPRPPGLAGMVMPLSSKRHGGQFHQIYFAYRANIGAPWSEPNRQYLETVNVEGTTSVDGFLTDDGLTLYFAAARSDPRNADLYRVRRVATDQSFGEPELLRGLDTKADERDPWLSPNGDWLYYSSNRTGLYAIYRARRAPP